MYTIQFWGNIFFFPLFLVLLFGRDASKRVAEVNVVLGRRGAAEWGGHVDMICSLLTSKFLVLISSHDELSPPQS